MPKPRHDNQRDTPVFTSPMEHQPIIVCRVVYASEALVPYNMVVVDIVTSQEYHVDIREEEKVENSGIGDEDGNL
jgi:hypothetical protein